MRIAIVEPDGAGGMIHYAYHLADALSGAGAAVTLHTSRHYELAGLPHRFAVSAEMELWPAIEPPPAHHRAGAMLRRIRRVGRGVRYAIAWHRLTGRLIRDRPDAVVFDTIRFPFQVVFLRRLRRHRIVLAQVCHEFEPRERGRWSRALIRRLSLGVYRTFAVIFLHGEHNRKSFHDIFPIDPDRTRCITHGNEALLLRLLDHGGDLRGRYGIGDSEPVVLFFGGLRPSKGIPDLIDAFAEAVGDRSGRLLIVGHPTGVDPAELRARAVRHGVGDRVIVDARYVALGEIGPLVRTATCVALPYRSATASGVLQAAYTFGRPVVATALGSLPEDVEHGATGRLVAPGDAPGMAQALATMLTEPAAAARMGANALRAADERFSWDPIARTILDSLGEVSP